MKKNLFRALALSATALFGSALMYVQAAGEDDPEAGNTPESVDFTLTADNPYNLLLSGGYLPEGTIMKEGPISAVYNNDRSAIGSFYGENSSSPGASITFIPDAGYKITSVKFLQNGETDRTDKFTVDGYTYYKNTSGTTNVSDIIVEYEAEPETGVDEKLANAFTAGVSETVRNAYACMAKVSLAGADTKSIIYTAMPEALKNFKTEAAKFSSVEEVEKYFADETQKFYDSLGADIKECLADQENSYYFRSQAMIDAGAKNSYLSNSLYAIGSDESTYITNGSSLGALFTPVAVGEDTDVFRLHSISTGLNMASASAGEGFVGPVSGATPNELALKMTLTDNHVQLLLSDNAEKAVGVDTETGRIKILPASDPATMMCVSRSTKANTLSTASSAIYTWGNAMPDFKNDVTEFRNRVTAAETFAEATAIIKEAQQAMMAKFAQGEVNMAVNSLYNKYVGFVNAEWKTDIPTEDAPRWILTFDSNVTDFYGVKLFDKTSGTYLGPDCSMSDESSAGLYAFVFEPGSAVSLVMPGKTAANCLTFDSAENVLTVGDYCDRVDAIANYTFKFVYNPLPIAEVVEALTENLEKAEQLGKLYLQSVPFAGQNARGIIEKNIGSALDNIDPVAAPIRSIEAADEYVAEIVANLEAALLSDLNANIGKELVMWQPIQKGYLSALTRDPGNKGFVDFDYQAKIDGNAAWTPVADGEEGQFFLKSSKGEYISTPNVNYCHVAQEQPTAPDGVFSFGLKDGYVVFQSAAHEGCGLGFDCQNDPVEIMNLTDKSNGYRWQVALMDTYRHSYVTFKSKRWDKYLQDADEAVEVNGQSSTLSSAADLSANTIWEVLNGTAEGASHIRNFATGKYLVKLDTPSQTVESPVDIWLTPYEDGVQICTGATVNMNCLDADNNGKLTGKWANDTGTTWYQTAISEDEVKAKYGNVYVTFEANSKDWGAYLQDSFQPAAGTDATLCGVDSICQNAIWQITPGNAEGAFHVRNFATGKYLVALNPEGSKTVSEPVDIWMPELTLGDRTGVQICTAAAPADSNCLQSNEADRLAGCGANSEGCLWIKSQLDEYTDAQIRLIYPAADRTIALTIEERAKAFRADCENYLESVPGGEEIVEDAIARLDEIIANSDEIAKDFKRVAFLEPYFAELKASYETPLLEQLYRQANEGVVFSFEINSLAGGLCYYSSSLYSINNSDAALLPTKEFSAGNLFRFEQSGDDLALYSVNTNCRIYGDGAAANKIGTLSDSYKTEINFRLALADGFVRLNAVKADNSAAPIGIFTTRGTLGTFNTDASTHNLKLQAHTLAETAEMANTQLSLWGALMPDGEKIATDAAAAVNAAESAAAIGQAMVDAKKAMIDTLLGSDDIYFKSVNTDLFIGFDAAWYSDFAENEASVWKLTPPADYETSGTYSNLFLMKDETADTYLSYRCGNTSDPNTDPDVAQPDYYAIAFDNPGVITVSVPRNSNWNALAASGNGLDCNGVYGERYKAESIAPYCFAFSVKGGAVGVESVSAISDSDVVYDLMGHRVKNPGKGIYIVNGKKVMIR